MSVTSFVSFDVEALPGRAQEDHVQRLIWGKVNQEEHDIRRICQILNEYKIKGNFLVDMAACALYGDRPVQEVGEFILGEGHELHAHLHSEWLLRQWGVKGEFRGPAGLDQLDLNTNQILLQHTHRKFRHLFGHDPLVFRGGGYHFNQFTIAAAQDAGFRCLSNFNAQRHAHQVTLQGHTAENEAFAWDNGLIELPVDFSPEPLSHPKEKYLGQFGRVLRRKRNRTFNLTLHSWSLLKCVGTYFAEPALAHEIRLREILEHLLQHTTPIGYADFLSGLAEAPRPRPSATFTTTTVVAQFDPDLVCNICVTILQAGTTAICPGCGSAARQRQLQSAMSSIDNPFRGKRVLATSTDAMERTVLFSESAEVLHFDCTPSSDAQLQMDLQDMAAIPDGSFDGFVALRALSLVKDDAAALREIHRVLRPDGWALLTPPGLTEKSPGAPDTPAGCTTQSRRNQWIDDVARTLPPPFEHITVKGRDRVTGQTMSVLLLRKLSSPGKSISP